MIAFLEGTIVAHEEDAVILAVGGVGYRIYSGRELSEVGEVTRLWITEVIREDRYDLYGFLRREEQVLFEQLTGVSGVGPKLAQKILASGTVQSIVQRITAGDVDMLTSISGVGKKTAQKIILDLRGTLVSVAADGGVVRSDVSDALESLGYSKTDIASISKDIVGESTEERIKSALKLLSRHV